MTAGTFTRDGSRIVIRPGPGAWTSEFAWSYAMVKHERCEGEGWLWPHEVGDHETDQRYTCHECEGSGFIPSTDDYPLTTDVPAGDGFTIRYTIHVAALPPEEGIPMYRVVLEATEAGADPNGPHMVLILSDVVMTAWRFDEPGEVRESAEGSIRQAHHWVALALRMAAPMDKAKAEWLAACHVCGMDDSSEIVAALRCPPLGLVEA